MVHLDDFYEELCETLNLDMLFLHIDINYSNNICLKDYFIPLYCLCSLSRISCLYLWGFISVLFILFP